jgi:hypothetical protein
MGFEARTFGTPKTKVSNHLSAARPFKGNRQAATVALVKAVLGLRIVPGEELIEPEVCTRGA